MFIRPSMLLGFVALLGCSHAATDSTGGEARNNLSQVPASTAER